LVLVNSHDPMHQREEFARYQTRLVWLALSEGSQSERLRRIRIAGVTDAERGRQPCDTTA
jgi:hypothetical protein